MTKAVRGLCLIINLEKFDDPDTDDRSGSSVDAKNLEELAKELGFEVSDHSNDACALTSISVTIAFCIF